MFVFGFLLFYNCFCVCSFFLGALFLVIPTSLTAFTLFFSRWLDSSSLTLARRFSPNRKNAPRKENSVKRIFYDVL